MAPISRVLIYAAIGLALFWTPRASYSQDPSVLTEQIQADSSPTERAKLLNDMAYEMREIDQMMALSYATQADSLAASIPDSLQLARAKGNIGWIYYRLGNWENTFSYSREAYDISLKIGDANETAMALNNLGALYYQQQNYTEAIRLFQEAYAYVKDTDNHLTIIRSLNNTALNFVRINEPDSAMYYAEKAIDFNISVGTPFTLSFPYRVIGDVNMSRNNIPVAIQWYEDALRIARERNLTAFQAGILHRIGHAEFQRGNIRMAFEYLKTGEELSASQGLLDELSTTYKHLSHLYEAQGNVRLAYDYLKKHLELLNELESKAVRDRIAIVQGMFEAARKESELRVLQAENKLKLTRISSVEQFNLLLKTGGLVVFGLLLWVFWLFRRVKGVNASLVTQKTFISEQNDTLARVAQELRESNETKNKLLSILSHDLRTPVAQVKSMLGLLTRSEISRQEFHSMANLMVQDVNRLYLTLDNLLKWAKSQMAGFNTKPVAMKIGTAVDHVLEFYRPTASDKGIQFQNTVDATHTAQVDSDHLDLILRNLISNAVKFSHTGGKVLISSEENSDKILIHIQDFGIGLSGEQIEQITNRNVEVIPTRNGTNMETGNGLGLSLTQNFIHMNGGALRVSSKPQQGSTFTVALPKA